MHWTELAWWEYALLGVIGIGGIAFIYGMYLLLKAAEQFGKDVGYVMAHSIRRRP